MSQQQNRTATTWVFENVKSRSRNPGSITRSPRVQDIAEQITQTCETSVKLRKPETSFLPEINHAPKERDCWLGSDEWLLWERYVSGEATDLLSGTLNSFFSCSATF